MTLDTVFGAALVIGFAGIVTIIPHWKGLDACFGLGSIAAFIRAGIVLLRRSRRPAAEGAPLSACVDLLSRFLAKNGATDDLRQETHSKWH